MALPRAYCLVMLIKSKASLEQTCQRQSNLAALPRENLGPQGDAELRAIRTKAANGLPLRRVAPAAGLRPALPPRGDSGLRESPLWSQEKLLLWQIDPPSTTSPRWCRLFLFLISIVMCFVVTKSFLLTCCLPILLMGMRYYFSRKVILHYLDCALHTDMSDIEQYYMKPPGSCFWVAVLDGNVVGIVAARGNEEDNTVELRRMSVDSNYRGKGIAKALGRKVLEFAVLNNYSSVVLGTTAVKMAAHKLYESLGFKHVGVVEHYALPGMTHSLLERMFFQLRYHRYRLQLREE
ncbi:N-acetylaspartate synthetase [Apteryx rowi]|uniref:N-acetylaspartate synthetase n=1 Tax=Apteryx rowi TaxID=308060 RepID=UPI000E1CC4FF|nr:N-acetylaspartate synthetase [Apteryx rowi]